MCYRIIFITAAEASCFTVSHNSSDGKSGGVLENEWMTADGHNAER